MVDNWTSLFCVIMLIVLGLSSLKVEMGILPARGSLFELRRESDLELRGEGCRDLGLVLDYPDLKTDKKIYLTLEEAGDAYGKGVKLRF